MVHGPGICGWGLREWPWVQFPALTSCVTLEKSPPLFVPLHLICEMLLPPWAGVFESGLLSWNFCSRRAGLRSWASLPLTGLRTEHIVRVGT